MGPDDPLTNAIRPPPNETPEERIARTQREQEARHISDRIDEELQRQEAEERRGPKAIKVLLLGQSESGKSTTLKNFQLMYEPKAFRTERASWRAVIQLNIVQSIHLILNAIDQVDESGRSDRTLRSVSPDLLKLKMRLMPLLQVEQTLLRRLTPTGSGETEATQLSYAQRSHAFLKEAAVNAAALWKNTFSRSRDDWERESFKSEDAIDWGDQNDSGPILHACSDDMIQLWNDNEVRKILEEQNLRIAELAGFYLDSLERVAALRYVPTDDDILRARLKTLGVTEHKFRISRGPAHWEDWRIFDVGGHRSQRAAWAPYFDDMDAIIFLAPISCFDQVLSEDPAMNRLEDSVNLWTSVVSNKLLKDTNLILFLNKIDILKAKLSAGIKMADFVVSYGDRVNDVENASAYLKRKFGSILRDNSPTDRMFYCHLTTVTDPKSTKIILLSRTYSIFEGNALIDVFAVTDLLMRQHLVQTSLIQ